MENSCKVDIDDSNADRAAEGIHCSSAGSAHALQQAIHEIVVIFIHQNTRRFFPNFLLLYPY